LAGVLGLPEFFLFFLSVVIFQAGIYWEDEMPDMVAITKFSEEDRRQILRFLGIRMKIWDREALENVDQQFWDTAQI
jgi:hypothetical protein